MFRILLSILMVAQVAACPYKCSASVAFAQSSERQVVQPCSCCDVSENVGESSSPDDREPSGGCCVCFCNGAADTSNHTTFSIDFHPDWIGVVDPQVTLESALSAVVDCGFRPPGDGSGKAVRLVHQSLLL